MSICVFFFFFKQKTAYEMRISDWSSDVCSSDLGDERPHVAVRRRDDAHVGAQRLIAADGRIFVALKHAEQPRLRLDRHVADFVEKERTASRLLETPRIAAVRAGERALFEIGRAHV